MSHKNMRECCWRKRYRYGRVGRCPKPVLVSTVPLAEKVDPSPKGSDEPIYLDVAEIEALRLVDLDKLTFEEAGERMNVSRNTIWRLVQGGREKLIRAIIEGRQILIRKD
jgi:excisionase family DNA binding protein